MLKDRERLDDLGCQGLKIIQNKDGYAFTSDAVLLANLAGAKRTDRVLEFGTGSGIIAILLAAKKGCREVVGLEIQQNLAEMARRSVAYNSLDAQVKIVEGDIKNADTLLGKECFDVVVTNPPYRKLLQPKNLPTERDIAKSEVLITLEEIVAKASVMLKYGGLFYIINKADRLDEMLWLMRQNRLMPKLLIPIQPTPSKDIDTVVIGAKKCGGEGIKVAKPLILYNSDGSYTDELRRLYGL